MGFLEKLGFRSAPAKAVPAKRIEVEAAPLAVSNDSTVADIQMVVGALTKLDTEFKNKVAVMLRQMLPESRERLVGIQRDLIKNRQAIAAARAILDESTDPLCQSEAQAIIDAYEEINRGLIQSAVTIIAKISAAAEVYQKLMQVLDQNEALMDTANMQIKHRIELAAMREELTIAQRSEGETSMYANSGMDEAIRQAAPELVGIIKGLVRVHEVMAVDIVEQLFADTGEGIERLTAAAAELTATTDVVHPSSLAMWQGAGVLEVPAEINESSVDGVIDRSQRIVAKIMEGCDELAAHDEMQKVVDMDPNEDISLTECYNRLHFAFSDAQKLDKRLQRDKFASHLHTIVDTLIALAAPIHRFKFLGMGLNEIYLYKNNLDFIVENFALLREEDQSRTISFFGDLPVRMGNFHEFYQGSTLHRINPADEGFGYLIRIIGNAEEETILDRRILDYLKGRIPRTDSLFKYYEHMLIARLKNVNTPRKLLAKYEPLLKDELKSLVTEHPNFKGSEVPRAI